MKQDYKYIVLGNGNDWCEYSYKDTQKRNDTTFFNKPLPCPYHKILSKLAKIHYSQTIRHFIQLPLKKVWFPYFAKSISPCKTDNLIIIIFDKHQFANDQHFLRYIKNHFQNAKLVYVFTNIVSKSGAKENNFLEKLNSFYDSIFTYDFGDAAKYRYNYFPNVYSLSESTENKAQQKVFFIGKAKDRFDKIIQTFEKIKEIGINCDFHIVGVPLSKQKYTNEISYNKPLSYYQVIEKIQESQCILDITQGESEGFTLRINEAIHFNKLLITTNQKVIDAPFYNSNFIKVITTPNDIQDETFNCLGKVKFNDRDREYFSVESFFSKIKESFKQLRSF